MSVTHVPCGLCGETSFQPVFPGTIDDPNLHPEWYFSSSRLKAGYLPIVQCKQCGLVMTNPCDDAETLEQVYRSLQDQDYDAEDQNRAYLARRRVHHIQKIIAQPHPRLLDVGCATGFFAGEGQKAGWVSTGLEPSNWAVQQARLRYPHVQFVQGVVESASFPQQAFDIITLWDVLEHVASPKSILAKMSGWLTNDGFLVINVPNVSSFPARIMGRHWVLFLREHLWYFSPETIETLLKSQGFQIIRIEANLVRFSVENIFRRLNQYTGKTSRLHLPPWLCSLSIQFPIGEMTVIAKKVADPLR